MIGRRLAADEASGSQAERRERKGSDFCVGNDCGKGPLARVDHLGERDAAPTGLELLGRGAYVPLFLSPNPPILCLTPRSISSRFPLRRKSGAHRLEIGPFISHLLVLRGHACQHL